MVSAQGYGITIGKKGTSLAIWGLPSAKNHIFTLERDEGDCKGVNRQIHLATKSQYAMFWLGNRELLNPEKVAYQIPVQLDVYSRL